MRELAKVAGVSLNAVSLALQNRPGISTEVRERIQELAVRTGYRPDPVISSLMTRLRVARKNRSLETIAFLSFDKSRKDWAQNTHYYLEGAVRRADELGYRVDVFVPAEEKLTQSRMARILVARGIHGIILPSLPHAMGRVSFDWSRFAIARLGYSVVKPEAHRVAHNHHAGMVLALRELKRRGYRRPAFFTLAKQDQRVAHHWLSAYLMYYHVVFRKAPIPPMFQQAWSNEELSSWLQANKPDVIVSNMTHALKMLGELSLSVPGDIGFVNLDLHPHHQREGMSGIDQNPFEIGAAAVDVVAAQLTRNEFGLSRNPRTIHLEGTWIPGETVRSMPSHSPRGGRAAAKKTSGQD